MEDKLKDMKAMESAESVKALDSQALDAVSGGWEEPDGSISEAGGEPCHPRCKNSDCVLVDTKDGVFWRTNYYYRCKKCGMFTAVMGKDMVIYSDFNLDVLIDHLKKL